jgi:DNA-binding transcriptional regulator YiaG
MTEKAFERGNERIKQLQQLPGMADAIAAERERMEEADRVYAMSLAMIRDAGELTQVEVARRMQVNQGTVSKLERRNDMLLSTLRNYLEATGATDIAISVTVNGQHVQVPLADLGLSANGSGSGQRVTVLR